MFVHIVTCADNDFNIKLSDVPQLWQKLERVCSSLPLKQK